MNTVQLECFIEVSECLNFSRAAVNLKMTQPAVSHQINALESELNTKLFNRTSKSVELTRDGIRFIGPASDALKILNGAKTRIKEKTVQETIPIGICCRSPQMLDVLPPILFELEKEIPVARPVIKVSPYIPIDVVVENETIDVMFGMKNHDALQRRIIYKELLKCPLVCVCSENHPMAKYDSLKTDMLTGYGIALISRQKDTPEVAKVVTSASSTLQQSQIYLCDSYECAMPLIKTGMCYCVMPQLPIEGERGLKYIPITDASPVSFGVYYSTIKGNPVLKRFVEITREKLSG